MQETILSQVESKRAWVTAGIDPGGKGLNGQFMTPAVIARVMADMFPFPGSDSVRLLDPGAGSGALTSAFLDRLLEAGYRGEGVTVSAFESDPFLADELRKTASTATEMARKKDLSLGFSVLEEDFIAFALSVLRPELYENCCGFIPYTHAILNPPYRKLSTRSGYRKALEAIGIRANNLYVAFVALSIELLAEGGHLVAITPRSFCNGPYFKPFRQLILSQCQFEQIHVFESRSSAFKEDAVLQENIIFHLKKSRLRGRVVVSSSSGRGFNDMFQRVVPHDGVVSPNDQDLIIHIPANDIDEYVLERMARFKHRLVDLGLEVSTGPVVDFRVRKYIQDEYQDGLAPLLYPSHFAGNAIYWPQPNGRKPNAIQIGVPTSKWLLPNGNYVLTRRFSSKEEPRRIIPALFVALVEKHRTIGFENHLNVIHSGHAGLDLQLARGLTAFLASTIVDQYFRLFSGHTQVNAGDLRMLPMPDEQTLLDLAKFHNGKIVNRKLLDLRLEEIFVRELNISSPDPVKFASV